MAFDFTSPVGRLVSGDAFEPQTKNQQGAPLVDKQGQPTKRWFIGVAFDKANPEFTPWYQQYNAQAMADWPHLFDPATGQCRAANFSWKIVDGDGFDQAGRPWAEREGYAGHWVVRFQSGFAPSVYHKDRYDPLMKVTDPAQLPRGYYVRVNGSAKGNGNNEKPGMYCNVQLIEIFAPGQPIIGGPDVAGAFGSGPAPTYIPQGVLASPAMATTGLPGAPLVAGQPMAGQPATIPTAGVPAMSTGLPGAPLVAGQPMAGQPATIPTAGVPAMSTVPAPTPTPDPAFVAGVVGAAPVIGPVMGPNAQGFTIEQWRAQGYTDDQLRAAQVIL